MGYPTFPQIFPQPAVESARADSEFEGLPVFADGFKRWRRGACVPAAILATDQLVEGRDYVVQGYVCFARRRTAVTWHSHTWMEINGQIYDPTLVQFRVLRSYRSGNLARRAHERFSPDQWRAQIAKSDLLFWVARVREFGGRISLADPDGLEFHSHPGAEEACA